MSDETTQIQSEQSEAPQAAPVQAEQPRTTPSEHGHRSESPRPERGDSPGSDAPRVPKFRRKSCRFCASKDIPIDYKRPDILEKFITERGKILPRRVTGTCARHQRAVAREIKRARTIALLPFVEK